MHISLKFILVISLILSASYFLFSGNNLSEKIMSDIELVESVKGEQVTQRLLPDYDLRGKQAKTIIEISAEVDSYDADKVLAQSEATLQVMITDYDQVLFDPVARKLIEAQVKEEGKEYKKAILEKMSKGEL